MLILWLAIEPRLWLLHWRLHVSPSWTHGLGWDHACHAGASSDHQRHVSCAWERKGDICMRDMV